MRIDTLIAAWLGAVAIAPFASADFTGLFIDYQGTTLTPGQGFVALHVYAGFDSALSVTGASLSPRGGASFYQNALGGATEPNPVLFPFDPNLQYDTFVTIGLKQQPFPPPTPNPLTALEPGSSMTASGFTGGWFTDGDAPQGLGQVIPGQPGFYVLLMQLTIQNPSFDVGMDASFTLAWKTATSGAQFVEVDFETPVAPPAPGALPLLAIAGLAGSRRRR